MKTTEARGEMVATAAFKLSHLGEHVQLLICSSLSDLFQIVPQTEKLQDQNWFRYELFSAHPSLSDSDSRTSMAVKSPQLPAAWWIWSQTGRAFPGCLHIVGSLILSKAAGASRLSMAPTQCSISEGRKQLLKSQLVTG